MICQISKIQNPYPHKIKTLFLFRKLLLYTGQECPHDDPEGASIIKTFKKIYRKNAIKVQNDGKASIVKLPPIMTHCQGMIELFCRKIAFLTKHVFINHRKGQKCPHGDAEWASIFKTFKKQLVKMRQKSKMMTKHQL